MVPEVVLLLAAGQWSLARAWWLEMRQILSAQDRRHELESRSAPSKAPVDPAVGEVSADIEANYKSTKAEISRPKLLRTETFEQYKKREDAERWTVRHSFFANMGGFRLRDGSGKVFIINAKHINYLVRKRYIGLPSITPLEINDRSKSDSLAKFLAVMQVGWLAIQVIARTIQKLETTSLEITTLSFVVCTLVTFVVWYRKPYDVQTFVMLEMPGLPVGGIDLKFTDESGRERDVLDEYVTGHRSRKVIDSNGTLLPPYNKLTIIDDGLPTFTDSFTDVHGHFWGRQPHDPNRIRNDRLPVMEKPVTLVCALTTLAYAGLHVAAWNIPLATHTEQMLWRISAVIMMGSVVTWFFMDHLEEYLTFRRTKKGATSDGVIVPWWRIPASIVVAILYGLARSYVIVESFIALRRMPASAYQQVDWGRWVPHI